MRGKERIMMRRWDYLVLKCPFILYTLSKLIYWIIAAPGYTFRQRKDTSVFNPCVTLLRHFSCNVAFIGRFISPGWTNCFEYKWPMCHFFVILSLWHLFQKLHIISLIQNQYIVKMLCLKIVIPSVFSDWANMRKDFSPSSIIQKQCIWKAI